MAIFRKDKANKIILKRVGLDTEKRAEKTEQLATEQEQVQTDVKVREVKLAKRTYDQVVPYQRKNYSEQEIIDRNIEFALKKNILIQVTPRRYYTPYILCAIAGILLVVCLFIALSKQPTELEKQYRNLQTIPTTITSDITNSQTESSKATTSQKNNMTTEGTAKP